MARGVTLTLLSIQVTINITYLPHRCTGRHRITIPQLMLPDPLNAHRLGVIDSCVLLSLEGAQGMAEVLKQSLLEFSLVTSN